MSIYRQAIPTDEERAADLLAAEHASAREVRRILIVGAAWCAFWLLAGLYLLGWAFHVDDVQTGMIFFYGGLTVGNAGIIVTIYRTVMKAADLGLFRS